MDHSIANIKAIADSLANAQAAVGINPVGLENYPGLHDLVREGDPAAGASPQAFDFYSPDTFNFTVLDVSANGKTLTVSSVGMNAATQNAGIEYSNGPQARTIFSFQIDGFGFDFCLQDDSSGAVSKLNTVTGDYSFSSCSGLLVGGKGVISKRGCLTSLTHTAADRRVLAKIDTCTNTGTVSAQLYSLGRTVTLTDRNIQDNICSCR